MALTRSIPIKHKVFSVSSLAAILSEITRHYKKPKDYEFWASFRLSIRRDETTTVSLDEPPKKFEPLLNERIRSISVRVDSGRPRKYVELELYHGSSSLLSQIVVHGETEEWVNAAHRRIEAVLDHVPEQSPVVEKFYFLIFPAMALLIGWPLKKLLLFWMLSVGAAKLVPWSPGLVAQHLVLAFGLGLFPSMMLLEYIRGAFPRVEIQTGPIKYWSEAKRRSRLGWILSLLLIGPSADLLYDLYKRLL